MVRKTLLATSALVVASSMALASQHAVPNAKVQQAMRDSRALAQPGLILGKDMIPIAVRGGKGTADKNNGMGKSAPILKPAKVDDFSKAPNARVLSYFGWLAGNNPHVSGPYSYSYCYEYSGSKCISGYSYKYSYDYTKEARSAAQPFTGVAKASMVQIYAEQYSGSGGATISIHNDNAGSVGTAVNGASGTFTNPPAFTEAFASSELQTVSFPAKKLNKNHTYWIVVSGGSSAGTVAWNGQDSNFTGSGFGLTGEDFNDSYSYTFHETYKTANGYSYVYNTPYSGGTNGWVQTAAGYWGEESGAFNVN